MRIHERRVLSLRSLWRVGSAFIIGGCSTATMQNKESHQNMARASSADSHLSQTDAITWDQIAKISVENAYEAILQLRPMFLVGRPGKSGTPIAPCAVIGRGMPDPLDVLKLVPAERVAEIRLLVAREAVTTWGTSCPGGVLLVTMVGANKEGRR